MLLEDRPATREAVFAALRERRMYDDEHRIRYKDGSVRWIWVLGHGVFAPDGSLRSSRGRTGHYPQEAGRGEAARGAALAKS